MSCSTTRYSKSLEGSKKNYNTKTALHRLEKPGACALSCIACTQFLYLPRQIFSQQTSLSFSLFVSAHHDSDFPCDLASLWFIIIRNTRSSRQSRRLLLFRVRRPCHGPSYPTQDSFFFGQAEKRKKKTKQKNDDVTVCCQDLASSWHSLTGRCIAGMRASG